MWRAIILTLSLIFGASNVSAKEVANENVLDQLGAAMVAGDLETVKSMLAPHALIVKDDPGGQANMRLEAFVANFAGRQKIDSKSNGKYLTFDVCGFSTIYLKIIQKGGAVAEVHLGSEGLMVPPIPFEMRDKFDRCKPPVIYE